MNLNAIKKVRIVDVITNRRKRGDCSILLQDENNELVFSITSGFAQAQLIALESKKLKSNRPLVYDHMVSLMKESGFEFHNVYISDFNGNIFICNLILKKNKQTLELDARPSDAIIFSLILDKPIYISQRLMNQVGIAVPQKYKQSNMMEKGTEVLIQEFGNWQNKFISQKPLFDKSKMKTECQIRESINTLIEFAYNNDQIEN